MPRDGSRPILLVDDDTDTLEAFGLLLNAEGFTVVATESASDALALLDTTEPAAIVMDLHLPPWTVTSSASGSTRCPRGALSPFWP